MACMKYRKLRIAWSVGAAFCLLLIVLWVRSYSLDPIFGCRNKNGSYMSIG